MRKKKNISTYLKPSELCQTIYFKDFKRHELAYLSNTHFNLLETIYTNIAALFNNMSNEEAELWVSNNPFVVNLQDLSESIGGKYSKSYDNIIGLLQDLTTVSVLTNVLHKNKSREYTLFTLIRKISWLTDVDNTSRQVKIWVEPDILYLYKEKEKFFTRFNSYIYISLKSKYTKQLYQFAKDYIGIQKRNVNYKLLLSMLNVDNSTGKYDLYGVFNRDILKKTVKELNEKSDIIVEYTPIKSRIDGKLMVTSIDFMSKFKAVIDRNEDIITVSDTDDSNDDIEQLIDEMIDKEASKNLEIISKTKKINNVKGYLTKIVENLNKNRDDYYYRVDIKRWIDSVKNEFKLDDSFNPVKNQLISIINFENNYALVTISNDFLLYSVSDGSYLTDTAKKTLNRINNFIQNTEYNIILHTTPTKIENLGCSYM